MLETATSQNGESQNRDKPNHESMCVCVDVNTVIVSLINQM